MEVCKQEQCVLLNLWTVYIQVSEENNHPSHKKRILYSGLLMFVVKHVLCILNGTRLATSFAVPIIWKEPIDHISDCCFFKLMSLVTHLKPIQYSISKSILSFQIGDAC